MPPKEKPMLLLSRVVYRAIIFPHKYKPVVPPLHLYGELCKTHQGYDYISGEIKPLIEMFKSEKSSLIEKRSALWAIGHIGASRDGAVLLNSLDIYADLSHMAQNCEFLSIRGTCLQVITLLAT